jgi:hypothetical protein
MKFEDKTEDDLYDLARRVGAVEAIATARHDRWHGLSGSELDTEELNINIGIFGAIEILIEPVSKFFYSDCDTIAVRETSGPDEEPGEGPAKE